MADKQISNLPAATSVDDSALFVIEQQGEAMKATGAQWKGYAIQAVQPYVNQIQEAAGDAEAAAEQAAASATAAAGAAQTAQNSATSASKSAQTAQEYSGKPPIIQNDTWWTWDAETQQYVDTGESARGDVMYATFEIDPQTGILTMYTPGGYDGPVFSINSDGYLEVSIDGQ